MYTNKIHCLIKVFVYLFLFKYKLTLLLWKMCLEYSYHILVFSLQADQQKFYYARKHGGFHMKRRLSACTGKKGMFSNRL